MRLPLEARESECLKLIYNDKLSCEESTELVIPDTCPDVGRMLDVRGQVLMVSKRAVSEGVAVTAVVEADVIFITEDDETPRSVSTKLSFEFSAIAKGADEDSHVAATLEMCRLEARTLNPRKLLIRAEVSADIKCYKEDVFILWDNLPDDADSGVHLLKKEISHSLVMGTAEKSFTVSDEYDMSGGSREAEIVSCVTALCVNDVKSVGNKLVFKATAETNAVFLGADGELFSSAFETQFSQILESDNNTDEQEVDIILSLMSADFVILPDREGGVIAANFRIGVQAVCVINMTSVYAADAYSNKYPFELETAQVPVMIPEATKKQKLRLEGMLSEEQISVVYLYCGGVCAETDGGKISFSVRVCGAGRNENGELVALSATLRGSEELSIEENQRLMVSGVCSGPVSATHGAGIWIDLFFNLAVFSKSELEAIRAIEIDTERPIDSDGQPSIVVLCSNPNAGLWDIAKKYGSTIGAIEAANSLCGDFCESTRPLIIPKA